MCQCPLRPQLWHVDTDNNLRKLSY
jgi:hypothetical protein